MKLFNFISVIVFALMACVAFVAGFYNPIHFLYATMCVVIAIVAMFDSTSDESLVSSIKSFWNSKI